MRARSKVLDFRSLIQCKAWLSWQTDLQEASIAVASKQRTGWADSHQIADANITLVKAICNAVFAESSSHKACVNVG